jgi:branched-subunit amino acid transport protein
VADHAEVTNLGKIVQDPATRRWLYGIAAAIIVALQVYNILTPEEAGAWENIISSIVALGTAGLSIPNTPAKKTDTEVLG